MIDQEPLNIVNPASYPAEILRKLDPEESVRASADTLLLQKNQVRAGVNSFNRRGALRAGGLVTALLANSALGTPRTVEAAVVAENPNVWNSQFWHPVFRETANSWKLYIMLNDPQGPAAILDEVYSRVYGGAKLGILDEVNEKFKMWHDKVNELKGQGKYQQANDVFESAGHCPWVGAAGIMNPKPDLAKPHEFYGVQINPQTKVGGLTMKWAGRPARFWASRFQEDCKTPTPDGEEGMGQIFAAVAQFKESKGEMPFVFTESGCQVWDRNTRRIYDNDVVDGFKNTDIGEVISVGPSQMTHAFAPAVEGDGINLRASQKTQIDWQYNSLVGNEGFINAVAYNRPDLLG